MRKWVLLIGFTLLAVVACQPTPADSPLPTPQPVGMSPLPSPPLTIPGGRVAFNSDRTGIYQIYVYDIEREEISQLTDGPARSIEPSWSPDGQRIAFSTAVGDGSHPELAVMNADGSNIIELTSDGAFAVGASWSPDGERIAFHSNHTGDFEVYIINADGSGLTNISNHASDDFMPDWSPDGNDIVFVSTRAGSFNLFRMRADGTGVQALTDDLTIDSYYPSWSPDGTRIAYTQKLPALFEIIYVMMADGSDPQPLTSLDTNNSRPSWISNDMILFTSDRDGSLQLYIMASDGSNQTPLSSDTLGHNADWTP